MASHVRTGDTVMINAGQHKGEVGEVIRVDRKNDRVFVKGLNMRTRNMRPSRLNPQGGVITREAGIHISNVNPVVDGKPTRVRFEVRPDGSKVRVAARGGKVLGTIRGARS